MERERKNILTFVSALAFFSSIFQIYDFHSSTEYTSKSKQFNIRLNFSHQMFNDWMFFFLFFSRWIEVSYRWNGILIGIHHTKPHIKTRKINFTDADKAKQSKALQKESKQMPMALQLHNVDVVQFNIVFQLGFDGNFEIHSFLSHVNCKWLHCWCGGGSGGFCCYRHFWFNIWYNISPYESTKWVGGKTYNRKNGFKWTNLKLKWHKSSNANFFLLLWNYTNI